MNKNIQRKGAILLAALSAAGYSANAGSVFYDLNTDPTSILTLYGTGVQSTYGGGAFLGGTPPFWQATGGASTTHAGTNVIGGGYLHLTDNTGSQRSAILFDDFDNGLVVKAFSFSMDVKIGDGTALPADGFSVNYIRSYDPVLTDVAMGGNPATDGGIWATGPNGEANLPEEGSQTGLGIGFDAWYSGGDGSWSNTGRKPGSAPLTDDVIGISVRLDNNLIYQFAMPTENGSCGDITSLQTGPQDANPTVQNPDGSFSGAGSGDLLCWQPVTVTLAEDGTLTVTYKGAELTPAGGLKTTFAPSAGRLVLVGRTGGSNQNNWVDNISINTIPATTPTVGPVTAGPLSFSFTITDVAAAGISVIVDPSSIAADLNGAPVMLTTTKSNLVTTVKATVPTPIPSGSTNTVTVTYKDTSKNSYSGERLFIEGSYVTVPASYAVSANAIDTTKPGFKEFPYETAAGENNQIGLVEEEVQGWNGPNLADATKFPLGYYIESGVINYARISLGDGQQGNFGNEVEIPGFPSPTGPNGYDNCALDIQTYLSIPASGSYTFGVSSDDGFRLSFGDSVGEKLSAIHAGQFDGGRGSSVPGTLFTAYFPSAGFYPARLLWYNGGGGANVEWFAVNGDGTYSLINDSTDPKSLKAYYSSSSVLPWVDAVRPDPTLFAEKSGVGASEPIEVALVDGTSSTINQSSIALTLNGTAVTPTITKTGSKTWVVVSNSYPNLLPVGTNVVSLTYSAGSTAPVTESWQFIVNAYGALDPNTATPIGSGNAAQPGFRLKGWQLDCIGANGQANDRAINTVSFAEQELLGLFGPNVLNVGSAESTGYWTNSSSFVLPGFINFDITPPDGDFQAPAYPDNGFPGIPGNPTASSPTENFAFEYQTYVEFPTAGYYTFGVNSDDGFATYNSTGPGAIFGLNINAPAAIAGRMGAVSAGTDDNGGFDIPLPKGTGLTGKVVYAQPNDASTSLSNAADVAGNIVLIDRGTVTFTQKFQTAIAAGAIGVIVVNNRSETSTEGDGPLPITMGGSATTNSQIPGVMISLNDGATLKAHLSDAGGVQVTLGQDSTPKLGQYNGGRGSSDTLYSFVVPQAGVYPLRTVYFQGGGGANCEWFSVSGGTKTLLNDVVPGALKTYRSVTVAPKPTVSVAFDATGANAVITFTGTLQSATAPGGPFTDVSATSPLTVPLGSVAKTVLYRSRN